MPQTAILPSEISNTCQVLLEDSAGNTYIPKIHVQIRERDDSIHNALPPAVAQSALLILEMADDGNIASISPAMNRPVSIHGFRVITDPQHQHQSTVCINVTSPLLQQTPAGTSPRNNVLNSLDDFKRRNVAIRELLFDPEIRDFFATAFDNKQTMGLFEQQQSQQQQQHQPWQLSTSPASTAINSFLTDRTLPRPDLAMMDTTKSSNPDNNMLPQLQINKAHRVVPISVISHHPDSSATQAHADSSHTASSNSPKPSPFKQRSHSWTPPPTMDAYFESYDATGGNGGNNDSGSSASDGEGGEHSSRNNARPRLPHHHDHHQHQQPRREQRYRGLHPQPSGIAQAVEDKSNIGINEQRPFEETEKGGTDKREQLQIDAESYLKHAMEQLVQAFVNTVGDKEHAEDFKKGVVRNLLREMAGDGPQ